VTPLCFPSMSQLNLNIKKKQPRFFTGSLFSKNHSHSQSSHFSIDFPDSYLPSARSAQAQAQATSLLEGQVHGAPIFGFLHGAYGLLILLLLRAWRGAGSWWLGRKTRGIPMKHKENLQLDEEISIKLNRCFFFGLIYKTWRMACDFFCGRCFMFHQILFTIHEGWVTTCVRHCRFQRSENNRCFCHTPITRCGCWSCPSTLFLWSHPIIEIPHPKIVRQKNNVYSHRIHVYAIYGNIYHQYTPNVSIYTIHGSYEIGKVMFVFQRFFDFYGSNQLIVMWSIP